MTALPAEGAIIEFYRGRSRAERDAMAARLLALDDPRYHGSITVHYADGVARKIEDKRVRNLLDKL